MWPAEIISALSNHARNTSEAVIHCVHMRTMSQYKDKSKTLSHHNGSGKYLLQCSGIHLIYTHQWSLRTAYGRWRQTFQCIIIFDPLIIEPVWERIHTLWAAAKFGLPNTLVFDDGSEFRYTIERICETHDVEYKKTGTQHHSWYGLVRDTVNL